MNTNISNKSYMIKEIIFALLLIVFTSMVSCKKEIEKPSETIVSKSYSFSRINDFTAATKGISVYYTQKDETSLRAEGPENMMKQLRIKSDKLGKLLIEINDCDYFDITSDSQDVKVYITSPSISTITAMIGASVSATGAIDVPGVLEVNAFSKSKISLGEVSARNLKVRAFEYSSISFEGIQAATISAESFTGAFITNSGNSIGKYY